MTASGYSIWIVSPPGYVHSHCFDEVALSLRDGFAELGIAAPIVATPPDRGTVITLGANLMANTVERVPDNFVLYNFEQITPSSPWCSAAYLRLLRSARVWDYSEVNVQALAELGIRATLCELGYVPSLTRITPREPDIDVLFVGSINERRARVLLALEDAGKRVVAAFKVYGAERDALFARAKLVLNVHFYDARVFEIVRVSYLLANRMCVVSERGADASIEAALADGVAFTGYDQLVGTCLRLLDDPAAREALAERGQQLYAARPQAPRLRAALEAQDAPERGCA